MKHLADNATSVKHIADRAAIVRHVAESVSSVKKLVADSAVALWRVLQGAADMFTALARKFSENFPLLFQTSHQISVFVPVWVRLVGVRGSATAALRREALGYSSFSVWRL